MIRKLLIANRGEIAVRLIRACAEMGITSVAVHTDADRHALHVKKADEAYAIGPDSMGGYLSIHRLISVARAAGCDAVHPGYGFLSENADFAAACAARGLIWVGPDASVIRRMGDKVAARQAMIEAGVPVTPGSEGNLETLEAALEAAEAIGYPVMLKATSGGGGRGIRLCEDPDALRRNFDRVRSEATRAFGSTEIFLEKAVVNPRHIEVQILADTHGNAVHLYERDCSVQRRHQKLIEIAPSPQLNEAQRERLGALAVTAAQTVGYQNAGTVEFLMDGDDTFYFMEMNTRLQVEHPATEMITGVDIVQEQLRIASGEPLRYDQSQISRRGFAMEFRINAEDPTNDFLPSFGRITRYFAPGGPGVRTDGAIYTGYEIPPHYDSMCAKLICWALEWDDLLTRSNRALRDMGVFGVKTTIPYHLAIVNHPDFRRADFNTGFIAEHPELTNLPAKRSDRQLAVAIAAAIAAHHGL
ncbi:acetyl-CoA carboxylase, biotin carboxylase [Thioalkalivibrio sp. K90mix]|uniref:acetyl-CoA carboxylase biotin carboxylase subunit n=1 Tax=unclassified Thioalkalivibrio TaxID=2621013 RepID=UPI000195A41E|nr:MULTISPECIES: acetyl-CoA carboxylase biotin carboxylase subunit [unclassified Thioalkalivibrio]ADC72102.1 acetyl-CoA carboxylase, biotin carboxylase [Thioalkalivibrio sp. K90mix]